MKRADYGILISQVPFPSITICPDSLVFKKLFDYKDKLRDGNFTYDEWVVKYFLIILNAIKLIPALQHTKFWIFSTIKTTFPKTFQRTPLWRHSRNTRRSTGLTTITLFFGIILLVFRSVPFWQSGDCASTSTSFHLRFCCMKKRKNSFQFNKINFEFFFCSVSKDFRYEPPLWFKNSKHIETPWKSPNSVNGLFFMDQRDGRKKLYIDTSMLQPLSGFRIIVHDANTLPYRTGFHIFHGNSDDDNLYLFAQLTLIDKSLESWTPDERNCFMKNEKSLKYFRIYTKVNCEHECISQAMLVSCGCVPFYMISEFNSRMLSFKYL